MIEVNIVGTGNVAWHLAKALGSQNQAILMQVAGRSPEKLKNFNNIARETVSIHNLKPADVTIITVSDDAIKSISEQIPFDNSLVVHTSGFTAMSTLSRKHNKGVFYPLQSFSKEDTSIDFTEIPILIEAGDPKDEKTLKTLAAIISNNVQVINSKQRRQLHLAAVFANNFTNHCYTIAQELCDVHGVPFDTLYPLIQKTTEKALQQGPKNSQTGPAKRDDKQVIDQQIKLLTDPDHTAVYKNITKAITHFYGKEL
ncbi:putative short-subunit dehydrogenase-like oxidoreductase (DUF2520 family) [Dokdonia sp. Hel_I_63]|uniref:Rossmann-like and DUF2520 domain-containing protein n=1 Tax=Dokdonia sp. Hel_I_63 TaxID=1249996 RepID=UPI001199C522|nr:DUF2520 domain-containing protein [Dokdonia sp. Hel_I_63]TVZ23471.1 putative short-subunit dehydrogenase-like oxidoreductase (DUF2520 family) [Dokdonia sp. Hel_I_63]